VSALTRVYCRSEDLPELLPDSLLESRERKEQIFEKGEEDSVDEDEDVDVAQAEKSCQAVNETHVDNWIALNAWSASSSENNKKKKNETLIDNEETLIDNEETLR